jgi:serine/threonine protein kinase
LVDFGIARYAEASTAPDTRKHSLTPLYASPEQWALEHATPAADVYALGAPIRTTAFESALAAAETTSATLATQLGATSG